MKIAHVGPTAQNAYLNAKFQRERGIEADCYDFGLYPHWLPEWEEGVFRTVPQDATQPVAPSWDLDEVWAKPEWCRSLDAGPMPIKPAVPQLTAAERQQCYADLAEGETLYRNPDLAVLRYWDAVMALAPQYDLLVLYGPMIACGQGLPPDRPWIAFSHGTTRYVPMQLIPIHRHLGRALRHATVVLETNGDCGAGLDSLHIPARFWWHPVDTDRFTPAPAPSHRALVLHNGESLLFFAPARMTWNKHRDAKHNDRILHAFAEYCRLPDLPAARLVMVASGDAVQTWQLLANHLQLQDHITWIPVQPKRHLLRYYQAADIVLDQFGVGSFGTITVEALSCGKPVITYINAAHYEWCRDVLPELPPVAPAETIPEIAAQLVRLATDRATRTRLGNDGREWVEQYHGKVLVTNETIALCERTVANRSKGQ